MKIITLAPFTVHSTIHEQWGDDYTHEIHVHTKIKILAKFSINKIRHILKAFKLLHVHVFNTAACH